MEQPEVYVGVDVGKQQLEVALRPSGEQFSLLNDERAVRALVKRLAPLGCARIVVEATGGYETLVVAALHAGGLPVVLVNPRWTRAFAKAIGQLHASWPCMRSAPSSNCGSYPMRKPASCARCARAAMTCWT
jgi:transposase